MVDTTSRNHTEYIDPVINPESVVSINGLSQFTLARKQKHCATDRELSRALVILTYFVFPDRQRGKQKPNNLPFIALHT